jgi:hypothetical protein
MCFIFVSDISLSLDGLMPLSTSLTTKETESEKSESHVRSNNFYSASSHHEAATLPESEAYVFISRKRRLSPLPHLDPSKKNL